MKYIIATFLIAVSSLVAAADPAVKYVGPFDFSKGGIHKDGVKGDWKLTVDGDLVTQVYMKPTAKVVGRDDFTSTEQVAYSKALETGAEMIVIFKLAGPTHKWSYVYVGQTADEGKNYDGNFYKAEGTPDQIKTIWVAGDLSGWKNVGTGQLVNQ